MRLLTLFEEQNLTEVGPGSIIAQKRRIPMWVLEGTRADYDAYLSSLVFKSFLTEGINKKYLPIIEGFRQIDKMLSYPPEQGFYAQAERELNWASEILRREDRITWYMRLVKFTLLVDAESKASQTEMQKMNPQAWPALQKELGKFQRKLERLYGNEAGVVSAAAHAENHQFKTAMEHHLSMNIPKINGTVFKDQHPDELFREWREIEQEWSAHRNSVVDTSQDKDNDRVDMIMQFEDGSAWFNLNRSGCSIEATAMGHCGNGYRDDDSPETVLSFREPVDENGKRRDPNDGGVHWRPRMTFILNKKNGFLGEMKGRANNKPKPELHPYIIGLLMNPMIQGIVGGGYKPENNFSLDDLGEEKKAELIQKKPELGSLMDMYEMAGEEVTDKIVRRIEAIMDDYGLGYTSVDAEKIIFEVHNNIAYFTQAYNLDHAHRIIEYGEGNIYFDLGNQYTGDRYDRTSLANEIFKKKKSLWKSVQTYMLHAYPEEFGYELNDDHEPVELADEDKETEYDINDVEDVVTVADEQDEEWYDRLGWAVSDGYRYGAESSMYKGLKAWMENNEIIDTPGFYVHWENPDHLYDSKVGLAMKTKALIKMMANNSIDPESLALGYWKDNLDFNDIEEPYYGWDGYDEEAAIDSFVEHNEIPEVPTIEVPDGGNAKQSDVDDFKKAVAEHSKSGAVATNQKIEKWHTMVHGIGVMNGAIVANVHTWGNDADRHVEGGSQRAFTEVMKILAVIANDMGVPLVVRNFNEDDVTSDVEMMYKRQDNGYLRFDPKVTEATIKLRGHQSRSEDPTEEFMDDLWEAGQPHPFDRGAILIGPVGVIAGPYDGGIHISDIRTYEGAREGKATEVMKFLIDLANKHRVKLELIAKAYDQSNDVTTKDLARWYTKLGFRITGGDDYEGYYMEYNP